MGNVKKQKTRYVVVAAQQTLETLCVIINTYGKVTTTGGRRCATPPEECALCDQPTQASSTPVVQLVSTRDLLEILDAAEELKLATLADLRVSVSLRKSPPPTVPTVIS